MSKKIILSLLLLFSPYAISQISSTNPQPVKEITKENKKTNNNENEINFTSEQILQMDEHLSKGEYQEFFSIITKIKVSKNNYISFLTSKESQGHIPLYWLISDFYAKEKNELEAHKWFYIALIMTQQDSYLCKDKTARNAPRILMDFFPEALYLTRSTPKNIEPAMREVIYFISNIKTRIHPSWVCFYGTKPITSGKEILIDKSYWKKTREEVFSKTTDKFQK
jgi:hypothetical protein